VRTIERLFVIAAVSALLPTVVFAQGGGGRAVIPPRRPARAALKAERQAMRIDSAPPLGERAMLQRQVRQAWIGNVRRQLNLNNEQMRTLNQVNTKYDRQRSDIQRDERQARLGLKAAMEDTAATDQNARIDQQMNALVGAQRRRADLFENEQKELAGFLTPLQRARYSVMQERLQQRLQQLRQNQQDAPAGPPPPENPPER
jgi:Spy/CpxP family protein refolding chaperone